MKTYVAYVALLLPPGEAQNATEALVKTDVLLGKLEERGEVLDYAYLPQLGQHLGPQPIETTRSFLDYEAGDFLPHLLSLQDPAPRSLRGPVLALSGTEADALADLLHERTANASPAGIYDEILARLRASILADSRAQLDAQAQQGGVL